MATYTPPPYFPQGSLAPPDKNRYRKFKLMVALAAIVAVLLLSGIGYGIWKLVTWLF
ncbi:MAG TPA: hypothetical protein VIG25_03200 [Pyrinomonadaceae bacterium]|jgi:hypothetical protein